MKIREEQLYLPIKEYLESNGYSVNAEVYNCDITAQKEDELITIELKTSFNLKLIYQAIDRQKFSDSVYVAIPVNGEREYPKNIKQICNLLKRLELGLIVVHFLKTKDKVEIVHHPGLYERKTSHIKRRAVIRESSMRVMEMNTGGSASGKKVTLYRQQAIEIAVYLCMLGKASPRELVQLGCTKKSQSILSQNFYGWFERVSRGVYTVHTHGRKQLKAYPELVDHFTHSVQKKLNRKSSL